jgi:hypothetical protein
MGDSIYALYTFFPYNLHQNSVYCIIILSAESDFVAVVNAAVDVDSSTFPFNFTLMQDDVDEEDEMFNLVLSVGPGVDASIAPGSATATITITDEDCKTHT